MSNIQADDTFMYENKLIDDFDDVLTFSADTIGADFPDAHNAVDSPSHYNSGGIECIDAIKASMTAEEFKGYLKGNTEKYIWRYAYKNGLEDLKKAKVYLQWLIDNVEKDDAL